MKINLKTTLVILAASLVSVSASAQRAKRTATLNRADKRVAAPAPRVNSPFVGVWELATEAPLGSAQSNVSSGILKIFGGDNTFTHVQAGNGVTRKTHSGTYKIDNKLQYTEFVNEAKPDMVYNLEGQTFHLKYNFSADGKFLTISGSAKAKDGVTDLNYTEVWRKL